MAEVSASIAAGSSASGGITSTSKRNRLSFASVAALAASQQAESSDFISAANIRTGIVRKLDDSFDLTRHCLNGNTTALRESVARLNIMDHQGPIIASGDAETVGQTPVSERIRYDDEKTHLSFISNPTASTDVRSVVSGTTFAMDEKESIRPDESASVKAAEEDDSNSGGTSGGPQSLAGSEAGKAFRDQFHEISGVKQALPLTTNLVQRMPDETGRVALSATSMTFAFAPPDEKLLEALQSQRDRMFLLQLEQQLIAFAKNPKEQILHLPPNNAFCRLLAHRLADYYHLSHAAEPNNIVRIGKTEVLQLPPSLTEVSGQRTSPVIAPQAPPALKIMRRSDRIAEGVRVLALGQRVSDLVPNDGSSESFDSEYIGDTAPAALAREASSHGASPSKDAKRPTLEEREAIYNARREQLYKDVPDKQSAENSNAASRASSTLGGVKPKKKVIKNDDFEPRSAYMSMRYPGSQQQGYPYPVRLMQGMYGHTQDGSGMFPSTYIPGYASMHMAQQQQDYSTTETGKAYGNPYNQSAQKLHPYDTGYGFNMQQSPQMATSARFMGPVHMGQSLQPYNVPLYEPVFANYVPIQGQPQMMTTTPAYSGSQFVARHQHSHQQQGMYGYPVQGHSSFVSVSTGMPTFLPTNDGGSHAYSNDSNNYPVYGAIGGPSVSSGMNGNHGSQSLPPFNGNQSSKPHLSTNLGHQGSQPSGMVWPGRPQNLDTYHHEVQTDPHHGKSQLNKYDKSSLPPKPPAPAKSSR